MIKVAALLSLCLLLSNAHCQISVFNQNLASSFLYNSAYTGSTGQARAVSLIKSLPTTRLFNQPNFQSFSSYDQFIEGFGAVGAGFLYTKNTTSNYYALLLSYAPKFTIGKQLTVSPGFRFEYHRASLTRYFEVESGQGIDVSTGVSFNTKTLLVSFAFNQLYHPKLEDTFLNIDIPFTFSSQLAYRMKLKREKGYSINLTPSYFIYKNKYFNHHLTKLSLDYNFIAFGVGYDFGEQNTTINIGFIDKYIKIGYSFLILNNSLAALNPGPIHELSLQFVFNYAKGDKNDGFNLNKINQVE
jgi:hypothetical protein